MRREEQRRELTVLLQARRAALADVESLVRFEPDVTDSAAGPVPVSLRHPMARRIVWNYPRKDDGRLPLGEAVLLAPLSGASPDWNRSLWIAALSPQRRRDAQTLTLGVRWLIGANHAHRWDKAPWLWNPQVEATERERWGVEGLSLALAAVPEDTQSIAELRTRVGAGRGTPGERAALCILLQEAGSFSEALNLYGVTAAEIWEILGGKRLAHQPDRRQAGADALTEALSRCAPWRFADVLDGEAVRLEAWASEKRGRARRAPRFRLFALPGQSQQSKTSLMLTASDREGRDARLELEDTASNARLPVTLWQRPLELDLKRFGLLEDTDADD